MLISIGKNRKTEAADLVELLLECHERIRRFAGLARAVAERSDLPSDEVVDVCARVERYFVEALPLHVRDEEDSLLPRLRGREPDVDAALASMEAQHAGHGPKLRAVLDASAALRGSPSDASCKAALATAALELERDFEEHLALEEAILFPAVRRLLADPVQAEIVAELRARRALRTT